MCLLLKILEFEKIQIGFIFCFISLENIKSWTVKSSRITEQSELWKDTA